MDLNHLHLHVADLPRSQRFYESYFGFRERVRHGTIVFLGNDEGFDLALAPEGRLDKFPEWFHFGFRLPTAELVRAAQRSMTSNGVKILKPLYEDETRVTFRCADPDGYGIEIYWE